MKRKLFTKKSIFIFIFVLLFVSVYIGYSETKWDSVHIEKLSDVELSNEKKTTTNSSVFTSFEEEKNRLLKDLKCLFAFAKELEQMQMEMKRMRETFGLKKRGYYSSEEHDQIEYLLFRYLALRESLIDIINFYLDYPDIFSTPETKTKGFVMAFYSASLLMYYSSHLVSAFVDEALVIQKLNEAFYRYEIPEGTYDKLFKNVTSIDNIERFKAGWYLFSEELKNDDSVLYKTYKSDKTYKEIINQCKKFYNKSMDQIEFVLKEKSLWLPNIRNRLRHSKIVFLAEETKNVCQNNLSAVRAFIFTNVSRIKSPLSSIIRFSDEQLEKVKTIIKPGDIILTYTSGYMSNIFLPGKFKHGITYVGTPFERKEAGLVEGNFQDVPDFKKQKLLADIEEEKLSSGYEADVVEAVAEGVIFNSLEKIMDTHINRMLVLRPRLDQKEKIESLKTVFLLMNNGYDFQFDFNNASYHCCTEVIYRALNKKGDYSFSLVPRMGKQTLSADDIVHSYLMPDANSFDFVLFACEDPGTDNHSAMILTGKQGEDYLRNLILEDIRNTGKNE